jgi:hypothetical protein
VDHKSNKCVSPRPHAHFLLSPASADKLARFMQFVNANIA